MGQVNHRCAVLGKPIAHSLSPVLHAAAYAALGLDNWRYTRQEVAQDGLVRFLEGLDSSWVGLSLTMPLKKAIQPYGAACDFWSRCLHVSNTAVLDWAKEGGCRSRPFIRLYNTDVDGISLAFDHAWTKASVRSSSVAHAADNVAFIPGCRDEGASAVLLGNGNTALSALAALTRLVVPGKGPVKEVFVCARDTGSDGEFRMLLERLDVPVTLVSVPLSGAERYLHRADVAVSALPPHVADGLAGRLACMKPFPTSMFPTLLDVAYASRPSALVHAWTRLGGIGIGGEEMLLYQAIRQVGLMTEGYLPATNASDSFGSLVSDEDAGRGGMLERHMREALQTRMRVTNE